MRRLAHKRHFYEAFPFLLFFRIIEDETLIDEHEILEEDWKAIKNRWVLKNENWSSDPYAKSQRDEMGHRSRYNKLLFLKDRALWSQEGLKELYEKIGLKWHDDKEKRDTELIKAINKAKNLQKIFQGQKSKLEEEKLKEFEVKPKEDMGLETAYQCISSLELAGATIPDYEALTLGKYDALTATLQKKNKKAS